MLPERTKNKSGFINATPHSRKYFVRTGIDRLCSLQGAETVPLNTQIQCTHRHVTVFTVIVLLVMQSLTHSKMLCTKL